MQNAFSVDVEDYFQVAALAPAIPRSTWDERELRVERSTDRILRLLADRGVRGTFFTLGWIAERCPELVRRIAALGHEVACHGYSHDLVFRQSKAVFMEETRRAKSVLEDLCGHRVRGYRAASFSITKSSLWALDVLIDLGFEYDSSIFPIRHDRYGIPDGPVLPGTYEAPSGRAIVEFPMSTARLFGLSVPVSGGGYFRILPYWMSTQGLRSINSRGQPFTFYIHPWEVDPDQPKVAVSLLSTLRHYTNLDRCEERLSKVLRAFKFGTMHEVLCERGLLTTGAGDALGGERTTAPA